MLRTFKQSVLIITTGLSLSFSAYAESVILPIPDDPIEVTPKLELGKKLWFDPRLSKSGYISCNSCHNLSMGGTDNLSTSVGHNWQEGPINSPTIFNATYNVAQFWDGRADTLKDQALGPIKAYHEMASSEELVVEVLSSIPQYRAEFKTIYGDDKITIDRVAELLANFQDAMITPNSPFDLWLKGEESALTSLEKEGYENFKFMGCVVCHHGEGVGGKSFQKIGILEDFETENRSIGRAELTGFDEDLYAFKVPTLRNIELTYPYFHDGSVWELEEAVSIMGRLQLGREITKQESTSITAFLKTLTGEIPKIKMPILPPSNNSTPKPSPFIDLISVEDLQDDSELEDKIIDKKIN